MCTVTILPLRLTGSKAVELMEVELPNMPLDLFCWLLSTLINETRVREEDDGSTSNTWVIRIAKFIIQGSNDGHLHSHGHQDKDDNGDFRQNWYCQYVCNKTCEVGKNVGHAGQTDNLDEKTKQKLKKGRNRAVL